MCEREPGAPWDDVPEAWTRGDGARGRGLARGRSRVCECGCVRGGARAGAGGRRAWVRREMARQVVGRLEIGVLVTGEILLAVLVGWTVGRLI